MISKRMKLIEVVVFPNERDTKVIVEAMAAAIKVDEIRVAEMLERYTSKKQLFKSKRAWCINWINNQEIEGFKSYNNTKRHNHLVSTIFKKALKMSTISTNPITATTATTNTATTATTNTATTATTNTATTANNNTATTTTTTTASGDGLNSLLLASTIIASSSTTISGNENSLFLYIILHQQKLFQDYCAEVKVGIHLKTPFELSPKPAVKRRYMTQYGREAFKSENCFFFKVTRVLENDTDYETLFSNVVSTLCNY